MLWWHLNSISPPRRTDLVSISGFKPTAFEAVSSRQVLPLPFNRGADPLIRLFRKSITPGKADEGVGCDRGAAPQKTKWRCVKAAYVQ